MKKNIAFALSLICASFMSNINAQDNGVSINQTGATADPSAVLDVSSENKGILIPRMITKQKLSIQDPAQGLLVFDTETNSFWFFDGTNWQEGLNNTVNGATKSNCVGQCWGPGSPIASEATATAFGSSTEATEVNATAFGKNTTASGNQATAFGHNTKASGTNATALGSNTTASGYQATAFGYNATASGNQATAFGNTTFASGIYATAFGHHAIASDRNTTAFGQYTKASGTNATAFGYKTTASGSHATAFGYDVTAPSTYETAIGYFGTKYTPYSSSSINSSDRVFSIGNGSDKNNRANALTIYKDGRMNINDAYTMPNTGGAVNQVMANDGNGNVVWTSVLNQGTYMPMLSILGNSLSINGGNTVDLTSINTDKQNLSISNGNLFITNGNSVNLDNYTQNHLSTHLSSHIQNHFQQGSDASLSNGSGYLVLGNESSSNMVLDNNEIMARNSSGSLNTLYLNTDLASGTLGNVRIGNNLTLGGTLTQSSDRRLKTNILPLASALSNVTQLNGYTYNWKKETGRGEQNQIGLIAQEVQEVYPELVHANEEGQLSVNYNGLVPVLLEAIKEQQDKIEALEHQNSELSAIKADLKELKASLEQNGISTAISSK